MRIAGWKSAAIAAFAMAGIAVFLSATTTPPRHRPLQASPQEVVLELDPAQTKVHFSVESTLHMVHGTFNLKSGTVHFDQESGQAGGEIVVYATSGDSGNHSRDTRMHKEILQTQEYPDATFRPSQVEGRVALSGPSDVKLHGVMSLHGGEHEIVVPVHAELAADHWTGSARFDVPYVQWGIKDPSNWLLKVKPIVHVELDMAGTAKSPI
jgi:polyisoprenoid-binding protein YceI